MRLSRLSLAKLLANAGLFAVLSLTNQLASAHEGVHQQITPAAAEQAHQQAVDHTQALVALQKRWERAQSAEKSKLLEQLIAKAEERRAFLAELADSDPAEVLRVAIPDDMQVGMPSEVLEKLEQRLDIEGEFSVMHVDAEDGANSHYRYQVHTDFGDTFEVHFAKGLDADLSRVGRVRTAGTFVPDTKPDSAGHLVLNSEETEQILLAAGSTSTSTTSGTSLSGGTSVLGEQRVLVMLVNFQDNPTNKPYTMAQIASAYQDMNAYTQENSYGQASIRADIVDWNTLSVSSSTCPLTTIADQAEQMAAAKGFNLANYRTHVFLFPKNSNCGFSGLATVGGTPGQAWINGTSSWNLNMHEVGHTFGLFHSNSLSCGSSSVGTACTSSEYGDIIDVMGSGSPGHFNAYQKDRLGWLGNHLLTVTGDGVYKLSSYEYAGSYPAAIKVPKEIDPTTGTQTWYYLESRQLQGYDSPILYSNAAAGLTIHSGNETNGNSSYLLDMTPASSGGFWDAALETGATFTDAGSGVQISTNTKDQNYTEVTISTGAPQTCVPASPTLQLSPDSQWAYAGDSVSFSVSVANNDSRACAASSFSLSSQVPSGWAGQLNQSKLSLAPGETATVVLTVTSSSLSADGFYDVKVSTVHDGATVTDLTSYVVQAPATNSAPVAQNDSASTTENTPVTIAVLANDADPDGDALSVSSISGVNGSATINSNGSITFTPASGFSGTETFNYTISDGKGGSASATVTVTVAAVSSNQAPVAVDDSASTAAGTSVTIAVLGNDYDPDGDKLKVTAVTQGAKGAVTLNADGSVTFTPAKSFKNSDSFSYTISDGKVNASAVVNISLAGGTVTTSPNNGKGNNK